MRTTDKNFKIYCFVLCKDLYPESHIYVICYSGIDLSDKFLQCGILPAK